jgi:predicted RND superfamily exporter protein
VNRIFLFGGNHPLLALLAASALTLFTLQGLVDPWTGEVRLRLDPSTAGLLPAEGAERELFEYSRRLFGTDESVVVALGADDVFRPDVLERVARLTLRLSEIDGVQSVLSLSTAQMLRSEAGDLVVSPALETVPEDPEAARELRAEVLGNPLFAGTLVARDASATALLVSLDRMSDTELIARGIDAQIVEAAEAEAGDLDVWIAGVAHQKTYTSHQLSSEVAWMLPAILGLVALVLAVSVRSVRGVVLPLAAIVCGLIWTLGTLALLDRQLNLVTIVVPALILTVGFTYALHVVADYYAEISADHGIDSREAVRRTLDAVAVPVLITGITTAAGFVSLTLNPIPAVRQFGFYALLGVGYTMLAALTIVPATMALLPPARPPRQEGHEGLFERSADLLTRIAIDRRRRVVVAWLAVLGVSVLGMSQIRVAMLFPEGTDPENPIRVHWEEINARLGGATQLRLILQTEQPEGVLEPEHLLAIHDLQAWLEEQPDVGETTSIVDYLMMLNRAPHDDDPEYFSVPASKRLASQLLLFGGSEESSRLIDNRRQTTSVVVNATVGDSDLITELAERIEARMAELPGDLGGSVTGSGALLLKVSDDISRGQLVSISAAFVLIYLVMAVMFTSFRVALLALFPNALPIAVYFGALGLSGITLNPSTSLVGSMALGIAVDDTIHFFTRFNAEAKRAADERHGAQAALRALIRPVTFTTVGLVLGFSVLTLSELGSQVQVGLLSAFTIAVAWLVDITLSPALCSGVRIVTLWDVLRLDLGEAPHREIPLFEDLSLRQTRIFALMAEIRRMKAGERLVTEGESGNDMFVIIDGQLRAWVERDGTDVTLSTMSRGSVVGEVAYFAAKRTANVDASGDAVLIRFDSEDLERLRRRYPRTAATVFRNLNRVQAERLVRTTEKVQR